jgi:hypothetical protein
MGITEVEGEELSGDLHTITDAHELLADLETIGDTDDHVVHEGTVQTVHRAMAGLVRRTGEFDLISLNGDLDVRINFLAHLTKRAFNLDDVAIEKLNAHVGRKAYR